MDKNQLPRPKRFMAVVYLLLLVVALGAVIGLRRCYAPAGPLAPEREGFSKGDTIDVAIFYAPMNYYSYADTLGGYSYDLLRSMARSNGLKLRFWPVNSFSEAVARLGKGDYDLLASLPVTTDLKGKVLFTDSVFSDRQMLVTTDASDYSTVFDLDGASIHVEADSPVESRIRNLADEAGIEVKIESHPELSSELIVMKVAQEEFEYAVVNEQVARGMVKQFPALRIAPVGFTQMQAWAANPADSILVRRLNAMLKEFSRTSEAKKLRSRYFGAEQ